MHGANDHDPLTASDPTTIAVAAPAGCFHVATPSTLYPALPRTTARVLRGYSRMTPALLPHQRWYGEKGRTLTDVSMAPPTIIERSGVWIGLSIVTLAFTEGEPAIYFVPTVVGREPADREFAVIEAADGAA